MNKSKEFSLKCAFNSYQYEVNSANFSKIHGTQMPNEYILTNLLVKNRLLKEFETILAFPLRIQEQMNEIYFQFYEKAYFQYDQIVLHLQVYKNFPLLRTKSSIPIIFQDYKTKEPLVGPIFSNSDEDCMHGHFTGYNANTIPEMQKDTCQICGIDINQLQQNPILTILRDNVLNPRKQQIFYCPEYNRFKLLRRNISNPLNSQKILRPKISLDYLNYMHFRINLKKMTTKNRRPVDTKFSFQQCKLTFPFLNAQIAILDPAKGKYCDHYSFTDLRLIYLSYNAQRNEYKCPVEGCHSTMKDSQILYLNQVKVLIKFMKYKSKQNPRLYSRSKLLINHENKNVSLEYLQIKEEQVVSKVDLIPQFYKTLVNPFIPFGQYALNIPNKKRQKAQEEYMFGAFKGEEPHQEFENEGEMQNEDLQ